MEQNAVVDRHIGGHDQRVGGDHVSSDVDQAGHAALHGVGVAVTENAAAVAAQGPRESLHVLQWMELSLPRKHEAGSAIPLERRTPEPLDLL